MAAFASLAGCIVVVGLCVWFFSQTCTEPELVESVKDAERRERFKAMEQNAKPWPWPWRAR